jgi:hypothetical protein
MRWSLRLHPDCRCDAVTSIEVEATRIGATSLILHYRVTGTIEALLLPAVSESVRTIALWEHSCFEAFVRAGTGNPYVELNFAPSTQWAAFDFDDYRQGFRDAGIAAPSISVHASERQFELHCAVEMPLIADEPWRLALSAVIEERSGRKSYWALARAPGKPDFHHRDCFVAELARPSAA